MEAAPPTPSPWAFIHVPKTGGETVLLLLGAGEKTHASAEEVARRDPQLWRRIDVTNRHDRDRPHYSTFYGDDQELIDLVAHRFADDVRVFGYRFECGPTTRAEVGVIAHDAWHARV